MSAYRPNVAILVTDGHGRVLLCYRKHDGQTTAQTVQGGIDPGETAEQVAIREVYEEIGLKEGDYRILAKSQVTYRYEWPTQFLDQLEHKTYIGQEQQFFLIEVDPNVVFQLDHHYQEFERVCWGTPQEMVRLAWDKKRPVLEGALREFGLLAGDVHLSAR